MAVLRSSDSDKLPSVKPLADRLGATILDALPCPTLVVDAACRVVHANAAARTILHAVPGAALGDALGCTNVVRGVCGEVARCAACVFRDAARRALGGEAARARGFVIRTDRDGAPADLHLLAVASPLDVAGAPHAVLVFDDVDQILGDPGVVRVCGGCGRVEDQEGEWYPLHRFLEDRLGLEASEALCGECARGRGA